MGQMNDRTQQVSGLIQRLQQKYPTEIEAFLTFSGKTEATGAISAQAKSLINVALAVAAQCECCIALRVRRGSCGGDAGRNYRAGIYGRDDARGPRADVLNPAAAVFG